MLCGRALGFGSLNLVFPYYYSNFSQPQFSCSKISYLCPTDHTALEEDQMKWSVWWCFELWCTKYSCSYPLAAGILRYLSKYLLVCPGGTCCGVRTLIQGRGMRERLGRQEMVRRKEQSSLHPVQEKRDLLNQEGRQG